MAVPTVHYEGPLVTRKETAPAGTKWCAYHLRFCPSDSFGRDTRKRDGYQSSCRRAQAEMAGRTTKRVSKYNPAPAGMHWCSYHRAFEPIFIFGPQKKTRRDPSGLQANCIVGSRILARAGAARRYKENPAKILANARTQRAKRMRAPGTFTAEDEAKLRARQKRCHICGKRFTAADPATIDHVIALADGGSHDPSNIALAHLSCNCSKQDKRMHLL